MDLGVKDKVYMVAAASKGLGFGIAQALAQDGAKLCIGSRTEADINAAADRLKSETGAEVVGVVLDVRDGQSIKDWHATTLTKFGRVDGLVVNAGGPPAGNFDDFDEDDWYAAFELTLMSTMRMVKTVLPTMREQGGGSILAVTSASVKEPIPFLLLSNVMRSGVTSLLKSLSHQLAPENIRVNNLVPGRIDTDRVKSLDATNSAKEGISMEEYKARSEANIPLGRYGTIEDFGRAGAFLLSDAASYITGEMLIVDGGTMSTVW